jgi:deoxyribodipyrimidine photo-lyase
MQSNLLPAKTMRETALEKINAINLGTYARTRNALDGRVTRLSPYLTHCITDVPEIMTLLGKKHKVGWEDKFIFELGWREYFHHVWSHLGDDIWRSQVAPPTNKYAEKMPHDIVSATTGVNIIDEQIRTLYQTGYVHNHARMWLASYIVHVRKIDWRAGANWMYGYLLDGDMASNTLSWQWVAGTWTGKPYLFNAENVAKYAPDSINQGTVIDVSYAVMDDIARGDKPILSAPQATRDLVATIPPPLLDIAAALAIAKALGFTVSVALPTHDHALLMHPWAISTASQPNAAVVGFIVTEFHDEHLWSEARWRFVLSAMRELTDTLVVINAVAANVKAAANISIVNTLNPQYRDVVKQLSQHGATITQPPRAFINPDKCQRSFSSFWHKAQKATFPL